MNICMLNLCFLIIYGGLYFLYGVIIKRKPISTLLEVDISNSTFFIIVLAVFLSCTAASRSPFGLSQDYTTYEEIFHNSVLSFEQLYNLYPTNDLGYFILNKVFYAFNQNFNVFLGCIALFNLITVFYLYKKKSPIVWLSICLLLTIGSYYISYNAIRQFIAVDMFIISTFYIEKKDLKKYLIIIFIAFLIHKSAIFLVPLYWLLNINFIEKLGLKKILVCILLFVLLLLNLNKIIDIVQIFIFKNYSMNDYGMDGMSFGSIIRPLLIFILLLFQYKKINIKNRFNLMAFNSAFIWLLISIVSLKVFNISRFSYYFMPLTLVLIPICISNESNKKKRNTLLFIVLFISLAYGIVTQIGVTDTLVLKELL